MRPGLLGASTAARRTSALRLGQRRIRIDSAQTNANRSGYEDRSERHGDGKQPKADRACSVRNSFVE
jgi:hypothetical protein